MYFYLYTYITDNECEMWVPASSFVDSNIPNENTVQNDNSNTINDNVYEKLSDNGNFILFLLIFLHVIN